VGKLVKDENGIWQGTAMKDGKSVMVALDHKGDVTSR
jgi:putative membrane protein